MIQYSVILLFLRLPEKQTPHHSAKNKSLTANEVTTMHYNSEICTELLIILFPFHLCNNSRCTGSPVPNLFWYEDTNQPPFKQGFQYFMAFKKVQEKNQSKIEQFTVSVRKTFFPKMVKHSSDKAKIVSP